MQRRLHQLPKHDEAEQLELSREVAWHRLVQSRLPNEIATRSRNKLLVNLHDANQLFNTNRTIPLNTFNDLGRDDVGAFVLLVLIFEVCAVDFLDFGRVDATWLQHNFAGTRLTHI